MATDHPSYLLRGNTHLWPVLQFVFKRALEIADGGLTLYDRPYDLDPTPTGFDEWIKGYERSLVEDKENPLSYDIETPYKKKKSEDDLANEDDADHTILRISFSYFSSGSTHTCSIKWSAEYLAGIERLFKIAPFVLGWNSDNYDYPRVSRHVKIHGISVDGMVAWHILNSSLPKGLGFVTPYYVQNTLMWKHLSESQPAFYNAKDADMALQNYLGIKKDLIRNKLWEVFEIHVLRINEALNYMTGIGVLRDTKMRDEAELRLQGVLDGIEKKMEDVVPVEARKLKFYKKTPKVIKEGMFEVEKDYPVKYCGVCGVYRPTKGHAKVCPTYVVVEILERQKVWAEPLEFKISKLGMTNYQKSLRHMAVVNRREQKVTFDEDAIVRLMKDYPKDPLYPLIISHRKTQKLLSTYVGVTQESGRVRGGMPVGKDGRIHATYTHNPSTLRFACEDPNLQNLPRPNPSDPNDPVNIIRNLIIASPGNILYARDFSGIEAVLTGYFAMDPKYIRIAKRDIHTYYTVHALYELEGGARIKASDLPDLDWPDDRLFPYLEQLKKEFKRERNSLYKHLVHAANFMQSPKGAQEKIFSETRIEYPIKTVAKVMDVYYSLFPSIRRWHKAVLDEAEKDGYLRNPYGYVHRFSKVYDYTREYGEWVKKSGPDSNKVIAFKPQSTAAGIIKEAILELFFNRFEEAGQYLRLQVHDELLSEIPRGEWERVDGIMREVMERPNPQMRMPESWGMGEYLSILTEAKADLSEVSRWGSMKGL
jgi:DNA polymerase I-like protein with 3'-5' exonuclease and polymerase domains